MCVPLLVAPVFRGSGPGDPLLEVGLTALLSLNQGPQGQADAVTWPEPCPGWDAEVPFREASASGEMLTSDVSGRASDPGGHNLLDVLVQWVVDDRKGATFLPHFHTP